MNNGLLKKAEADKKAQEQQEKINEILKQYRIREYVNRTIEIMTRPQKEEIDRIKKKWGIE